MFLLAYILASTFAFIFWNSSSVIRPFAFKSHNFAISCIGSVLAEACAYWACCAACACFCIPYIFLLAVLRLHIFSVLTETIKFLLRCRFWISEAFFHPNVTYWLPISKFGMKGKREKLLKCLYLVTGVIWTPEFPKLQWTRSSSMFLPMQLRLDSL